MKNNSENKSHYSKKLKIKIIGGIIYLIVLILILSLLILTNTNFYISILVILFLFLLGIGPIISGFNKQRLRNLFHRRAPQSNQIDKAVIKRPNNMSLNFEYKTSLLKKCSKCGMLLISSVKKCPNCGNKKFD